MIIFELVIQNLVEFAKKLYIDHINLILPFVSSLLVGNVVPFLHKVYITQCMDYLNAIF